MKVGHKYHEISRKCSKYFNFWLKTLLILVNVSFCINFLSSPILIRLTYWMRIPCFLLRHLSRSYRFYLLHIFVMLARCNKNAYQPLGNICSISSVPLQLGRSNWRRSVNGSDLLIFCLYQLVPTKLSSRSQGVKWCYCPEQKKRHFRSRVASSL